MDLRTAEQCLHDRSRAAFAAAAEAGLAGRFRAFQRQGLLAVLTTAPGLGFLNSVCGLTEETADALPGVLADFAAADAPMPSVALGEPATALAAGLGRLGFRPAQPRPVGIAVPPARAMPARAMPAEAHGLRVAEAMTGAEERVFLDILAAGYRASAEVTRFMRAEHSAAAIRRFIAWHGDQPVAAAAFSIHDNVAVLGGAATVPAARRSGAQTALLRYRLNQAAAVGAHAAVATAAPESASARNLARAGFRMHNRAAWCPDLHPG